jgi:Tfp pilus assembly protein PilE
MNKKGFTLIELLAIIAIITIPKINKITEKSRKNSASLSAMGYMDVVEKYIMIESQNDEDFNLEGEFNVIDGVLQLGSDEYSINNTSNMLKIKYSSTTIDGTDGTKQWYWTQSARFNANSYFTNITDSGYVDSSSNASNSAGVAPAFRILD